MSIQMNISDLKATVVSVPIKKAYPTAFGAFSGHVTAVVVEVYTSDGLVGIGESPVLYSGEVTKQMIEFSRPLLLGQDSFDVDVLRKKLYAEYNLIHFHLHAANWALSGIEMALWDLIGKSCKKPLYKLWGGAIRKKIPFWGWVAGSDNFDSMVTESKNYVKDGFTTIYTKIGIDPQWDIQAVRSMREAVGDGVKIRVDANQAWSTSTAIKMIKKLEKYDLEFVEQPVLLYSLDALRRVKEAVDTPILSHESSWTFYDALKVIKSSAADAIQLDPRFDAGFTGARIAAGMAEADGMSSIIHSFSDLGITTAAYCHLIASSPSFLHANQTNYYALSDDVTKKMLVFKNGCIDVPEDPGIGVELDPEKMRRYSQVYEKEVKGKEISESEESRAVLEVRRNRISDWFPRSPQF
jgi:L-alanine-DL-glutamate epimerase-like enolase superfamily enzyme